MTRRQRLREIGRDQAGSMLVEVIVSGILLVIVAGGVFTAFDATSRATSEERHRARAHSLAQADLSRMRSMRISDLSNLHETKVVTQDDTPYTIDSDAEYQTDSTGTASCDAGVAAADYILITSTVTWPSIGTRPPVRASTLVAPPNGSVSADSGSLAVAVEDSQNVGISGVGVSGSGPDTFSGTTGSTGCVVFGNLPEGDYTVTLSGIASGLVDVDGNPPDAQTMSVVAESTNTVVLQYDDPGSIDLSFTTIPYGGGTPITASADSFIAFNTGMTAARVFPPTPAEASSIGGTSLFPFSSDYALYGGTCEGDNPNPNDLDPPPAPLAMASVLLPPGGSQAGTVQLPALHLTVYQGSDTSSARAGGALVKLWDIKCSNHLRTRTTNANGQLQDVGSNPGLNPGVPYTNYFVCVQFGGRQWWPPSSGIVSMDDPPDVTGGQPQNAFMTGSGSSSGSCP